MSLSSFSFNIGDADSFKSCIKVSDGGMLANGQHAIRFYNGCPSKAYINACVKDRQGNTKLYQSGRLVPTNGNFTIQTFPFVVPSSVDWTAGLFDPQIPGLCAKNDKK